MSSGPTVSVLQLSIAYTEFFLPRFSLRKCCRASVSFSKVSQVMRSLFQRVSRSFWKNA